MFGGVVFGQLGDIFGRKPILLVCLYAPIALGIGVYFSTSYEMFTTLRFFIGFFMQVELMQFDNFYFIFIFIIQNPGHSGVMFVESRTEGLASSKAFTINDLALLTISFF